MEAGFSQIQSQLELKESELRELRAELRELRDENKSLNEGVNRKVGKVKSEPVAEVKPDVLEECLSGEEESDELLSENDSSNNSENSLHSISKNLSS